MIDEEADEETGREVEHTGRVGGPDRRAHGQDVVIAEAFAITAARQILTQADFRAWLLQQFRGFAVEAQDVVQHAPERRLEQVLALCKQGIERGAVVFQSALCTGHGEAHFARLAFNFKEDRRAVRQSADQCGG